MANGHRLFNEYLDAIEELRAFHVIEDTSTGNIFDPVIEYRLTSEGYKKADEVIEKAGEVDDLPW